MLDAASPQPGVEILRTDVPSVEEGLHHSVVELRDTLDRQFAVQLDLIANLLRNGPPLHGDALALRVPRDELAAQEIDDADESALSISVGK